MLNLACWFFVAWPGAFPAPERSFVGPFLRDLAADAHRKGRADLDGDHVDDCWSIAVDGGSGQGGLRVEVRPHCGPEAFVLESSSSFGELLGVLGVTAPDLAPGLPEAFIPGLVTGLYGTPLTPRDAVDPAFAWLLDEAATRGQSGWRTFTPHVVPGAPALPRDAVMRLAGPGSAQLATVLDAGEPDRKALAAREARGAFVGLVTFSGAWLGGSLVKGARCGATQLWTTEHGVAAEDLRRHTWQWAYVSTAVGKLRWPSIQSASCDDSTIKVVRRTPQLPEERITIELAHARWRVEPAPE